MAEHYTNTYDIGITEASKLALQNINLNEGLKGIASTYNDWSEVLAKGQEDDAVKSTREYQDALKGLESNVKRMFGI
jgi:hypothetical protein